ncbi:MAG: hypothetical protein ACOC06_07385, partial [Halorubrum sp.]
EADTPDTAAARAVVFYQSSYSDFERYATGGMLQRPTRFWTSAGPAIAGEAGPEAIFPLSRMTNGNLGIAAVTTATGGGYLSPH